ncbi:Probable xanthine dehydrogenase subunit C PucC [Thermobacillus xylanilyticus]|jgi:carbon-monoxide dehydrogenase medium subunit|uniref:Probable xanthine dehydrogenase subunit C PucC n=1 Tax=Thermobacillus xylanilyticus TaxID=76633 RepID=A0ABM8V3Y5_THEXY|nr:FAD binding domain-containing protein [Thermobacillus xylanilyticus]REJ14931.1 MAG: molybdopterin dehydrogenase [Paenibacillaceae bacterium]CAG5084822.1 Probable xanthine dehydrogenase subunit C PucC [Thermobacillus xylanilyticus]
MAMKEQAPGRCPEVWRPRDAAEACRLKTAFGPDGVFTAGGTLLRTQWESGSAAMPGTLIDLTAIPGLAGIRADEGQLVIGPLVKLSELMRTEAVATAFPLLAEAVRRIGAPSVRNLATIGGNVASAVGDALPALLVHEAELLWHTGGRTETTALEDWLADPGRAQGVRLLTGIRLKRTDAEAPGGPPGRIVGAYRKLGRREAFTPSLVTIAVLGRLSEDGTLTGVRMAAGGGSAVPMRLRAAETVLEGARVTPDALVRVSEAVLAEYRPASDAFAGAEYRRTAAANLIAAEWLRLAGAGREGDGR